MACAIHPSDPVLPCSAGGCSGQGVWAFVDDLDSPNRIRIVGCDEHRQAVAVTAAQLMDRPDNATAMEVAKVLMRDEHRRHMERCGESCGCNVATDAHCRIMHFAV